MAYHLQWGGMPLHDAVGVNYKYGTTTDIKEQVPSICMGKGVYDGYLCMCNLI